LPQNAHQLHHKSQLLLKRKHMNFLVRTRNSMPTYRGHYDIHLGVPPNCTSQFQSTATPPAYELVADSTTDYSLSLDCASTAAFLKLKSILNTDSSSKSYTRKSKSYPDSQLSYQPTR
jgi:hypothetical protein